MCVTIKSRFTVSSILVVITTLKARHVVAIMLLRTNVTSVGILIRHWIESATKVLVVTLTFALMARERRRSFRKLWRVDTCARPEMVENRHRHVNIIRIVTPQRRGQRKSQTYR